MAAAQTKSPHLPSLICLSLSPPLDPVAAVPALPRMLHLPKKTLNQGCVEQINQSYMTPTNRHSAGFYVRGRWPVQEGRLPKIFAELPFNPETHDFMGLWALPGLLRQGLSEFKRLGLLFDLRDRECGKDHHGLSVPDRKPKRWRQQLAVQPDLDSEHLHGQHLLLTRSRPDTHLNLLFRYFYGTLSSRFGSYK